MVVSIVHLCVFLHAWVGNKGEMFVGLMGRRGLRGGKSTQSSGFRTHKWDCWESYCFNFTFLPVLVKVNISTAAYCVGMGVQALNESTKATLSLLPCLRLGFKRSMLFTRHLLSRNSNVILFRLIFMPKSCVCLCVCVKRK